MVAAVSYVRPGSHQRVWARLPWKAPWHAREHAEGTLSPWTRSPIGDPDVSANMRALPNCASAADTASACTDIAATTNAPAWVIDHTGTARAVIASSSY